MAADTPGETAPAITTGCKERFGLPEHSYGQAGDSQKPRNSVSPQKCAKASTSDDYEPDGSASVADRTLGMLHTNEEPSAGCDKGTVVTNG